MPSLAKRLEPIFDTLLEDYPTFSVQLAQLRSEFEKYLALRFLEETAGNVTDAAKLAGMSREGLHQILERQNIKSYYFRNICLDHTEKAS